MKYVVKFITDQIDMTYYRHMMAEMTTNIMPPQDYDFFERVDYKIGPIAVFFFTYPIESEELLFQQLQALAEGANGKLEITIAAITMEFSTKRTT